MQDHDGFQVMVFLHDRGTFTVLLVRRSDDRELAALRDVAAYEAAVAVVPLAATWTDLSAPRLSTGCE